MSRSLKPVWKLIVTKFLKPTRTPGMVIEEGLSRNLEKEALRQKKKNFDKRMLGKGEKLQVG